MAFCPDTYPHAAKAHQYALGVVSGEIPACRFVVLACQRQLDDLTRGEDEAWPFEYRPEIAESVCCFMEMFQHVKGKWRGALIVLEPWQCFSFCTLFGWVEKDTGLRRYRESYEEIPRKSGKSIKSALTGHYMFTADGEPGAEIYCLGNSEKQAHEVFRPAWMMASISPGFRHEFNVELAGSEKYPGNLYSTETGSRFEAMIGKPGDGSSPHCWIIDEYHEAKTDEGYDTGSTGMGSRSQPLLVVVTTAGTNTKSPCYQRRAEAIKTLERVGEIDERFFTIIFTVDKNDDWQDFDIWKKANPNYGVSVDETYLYRQYQTALKSPRKRNAILCKHLNIWSDAGEPFFDMVAWDKCADSTIEREDFEDCPAFIGLDLASKNDIASKMVLIPPLQAGGKYHLFSDHYLPESKTEGEEHAQHREWSENGYLTIINGKRIDQNIIYESILDDARIFDLSGMDSGAGEICNDPWNAQALVRDLEDQGLAVVEISQTVNFLSEPMKELASLIEEGRLVHDDNPVTRWCFANVTAKTDFKDNVFPRKEVPENKIDGAVATITAMCRAMLFDAENSGAKSVYDSMEIQTF